MKHILFFLFISVLFQNLWSLDIWINGEYFCSYDSEELYDYAQPDKSEKRGELQISGIVPLFNEVFRVEAYGGRNKIVLEEPEGILDSLSLVLSEEGSYLLRNEYRFENPSRLDIWGSLLTEDGLTVIIPENDPFTRDRLEIFCRYHRLEFKPITSEDPARELMNRIYQKKEIPQLVIFPESSYPSLAGHVGMNRNYCFTITSLFSRRDFRLKPMDLDSILAESSHSYSWNSYDYPTFSLFTDYYRGQGSSEGEALKRALVLNRSLKEMGILAVSSEPGSSGSDFFLAETTSFSLSGKVCYPQFIRPLYSYISLAVPLQQKDSKAAQAAIDFLLSPETQREIGWNVNGIYPVRTPEKIVHPSDPCLILINAHKGNAIHLSYNDESREMMDNWLTLSRLAMNSALSIDDLIKSAEREVRRSY
jgi:hypothetical protein